jgi:hypothetical protein
MLLEIGKKFKDGMGLGMMKACIENPSLDVACVARGEAATRLADPDPEPRYIVASDLLFCGQKDEAVQMLKS